MNKNILIVIIAVIVVIGGAGAYFAVNNFTQNKSQSLTEVQASIDEVGALIPDLNFSQSPLPDLSVSSLNVSVPNLNISGSAFSGLSANTDFSFDTSSINIAVPSANSYNIKMPSVPTGASGQQAPQNIPTQPGSGGAGQQGASPAVDCAQFASVPSCSMTGAGQAMCKQCYPNK